MYKNLVFIDTWFNGSKINSELLFYSFHYCSSVNEIQI